MTEADCRILEKMMMDESRDYMRYFTAFSILGELMRQRADAKRDAFFSIVEEGVPVGFFCMRGLDVGYARPSFGVYISSGHGGRGLARLALQKALFWCQESGIKKVMLKVSEENLRARHLYESAGFQPLGRCPDTGHLIMEREIP